MTAGTITLLTDFGLRDSYVAAMKGVIAGRAPASRIVDICHDVPAQDVRRGAMIWAEALAFFPPGCVHVGVIDPGVGSSRSILAFAARGSVLLAPDNGLASLALRASEVKAVFAVTARRLFLSAVSSTFHGRDIFAPVAAALANGLDIAAVGPRQRRHVRLTLPRPAVRRRGSGRDAYLELRGEVLCLDGFGNAITNLAPPPGRTLAALEVASLSMDRLSRTYSDAGAGSPLALVGSSGRIEIAVAGGDAALELGLRPGTPVISRWTK